MARIISIAEFSEETKRQLKKSAEGSGFNLSRTYNGDVISPDDFDFHVTVFATNEENHTFKSFPKTIILNNPIEILPTDTGTIGVEETYPAIFCEKQTRLVKLRQIFLDFGYTFTFDEWKPHITLSYFPDWDDLNARLFLPDFPLIIDKIRFKEFK